MEIDGIKITEEMTKAGFDVADRCYDASVEAALMGHISSSIITESKNSDLIQKYIDQEISSVQAIYIAMERAKQL